MMETWMLMTSVTFLYPVGREFPVSVFYTSFDALKASLSVAATSCQIRSFPHHIGCRIPLRKLSFCDSVVDVHLLQCHQTDQHRKIQSNWPQLQCRWSLSLLLPLALHLLSVAHEAQTTFLTSSQSAILVEIISSYGIS